MKCLDRTKAAFTIVEIILVIVVLSVTLALSVPNFSKSFSRLELRKTADNITYLIRYAQSRAIAERKTYLLRFLDNGTHYQILKGKTDQPDLAEDQFEPIKHHLGKVYMVPKAITITSTVDSLRVYSNGSLDKVRFHLRGKDRGLVISSVEQRSNVYIIDEDLPS
jgi:Tfp pilus assembly protein FimT